MSVDERLAALGLTLPPAPKPVAAYVPAVRAGNLVFTAGQIPFVNGELKYKGKVGKDLTPEEGQESARVCCLNALAAIKGVIGDLDQIAQVVKLTAFVNSADGFTGQPGVANGASELLVQVFGDAGRHARSAVASNELPLDSATEVELVVLLKG